MAEEDCPAYPEAPEDLVLKKVGADCQEKNAKQSAATKSALDNRFHRTALRINCGVIIDV